MISSGSLLLGLALAVAGDTTVPSVVATRVTALIAERWGVGPETLELVWGAHADWPQDLATVPVRLVGGGGDGWYGLTERKRGV